MQSCEIHFQQERRISTASSISSLCSGSCNQRCPKSRLARDFRFPNIARSSGGSHVLSLPEGATVADTKNLLADPLSIPADDQLLVHSAKILPDSVTLSSLDFSKRSFILVVRKSASSGASDDDFPLDLLRQIPAAKILKYRRRLEHDSHMFKRIIQKIAGNDQALAERLEGEREAILNFLGVNYTAFMVGSLMKSDDSQPVQQRKPPPEDHSFDRYAVNVITPGWSGHHPADDQPELLDGVDADEDPVDEDAIQRLMRLGLDRDGAERLFRMCGGDLAAAMTLVFLHQLGLG
jgi:hypothetical protein